MDNRYYPGVEVDAPRLMRELRDLFDEDYQVQTMQVASTSVMQARKESTLRDLTGNYLLSLHCFAVLSLLSVIAALAARQPKVAP